SPAAAIKASADTNTRETGAAKSGAAETAATETTAAESAAAEAADECYVTFPLRSQIVSAGRTRASIGYRRQGA
ncbi:MAG: hypothetical protein WCF79_21240, partial [Rhodomicrobium sp.]